MQDKPNLFHTFHGVFHKKTRAIVEKMNNTFRITTENRVAMQFFACIPVKILLYGRFCRIL